MNPWGIKGSAIDLIALRRYTSAVERSRAAYFAEQHSADTYAKRTARSEAALRYRARKKDAK